MKNPKQLFPLIITKKLAETKKYYTEKAGFSVVFDMESYLQVAYGNGVELCFMTPDASPDGKPLPEFNGKGLIVSVPTKNADEKHAALEEVGAAILASPVDKPWGWRSFMAVDPNGVVLDFFHVVRENPMVNASS